MIQGLALPGQLLEMQNLRPGHRTSEPDSAFCQDSGQFKHSVRKNTGTGFKECGYHFLLQTRGFLGEGALKERKGFDHRGSS